MKPILFNSEMVKALLEGRKTVTRRIVKPQPNDTFDRYYECFKKENGDLVVLNKPYRIGDILYVREAWRRVCAYEDYYEFGSCVSSEEFFGYRYRADNEIVWDERAPINNEYYLSNITSEEIKWHPSIHMPKEAARIFLRVIDVRVERLQEITTISAFWEGAGEPYNYQAPEYYDIRPGLQKDFHKAAFAGLWDSTVKPADRDRYGWDASPWVWVIEFERCAKPN